MGGQNSNGPMKSFLQAVIRPFFPPPPAPVPNLPPANPNIVGRTLVQRYRILSELGQGGFGKTYLAEDLQLPVKPAPRRVVKQLLSEKMSTSIKEYFYKEAQVLMDLGNHHNQIPSLHAYFEDQEIPFLVQDFIEGHDLAHEIACNSLDESISSKDRWTEEDTVIFLTDMLGVLEYIHGAGIIHRDLKPHNIMRRKSDGNLVLIDFGIVKNIRSSDSLPESSSRTAGIGTQGYTPIEQWYGRPVPASDLYALGMTAIQALTGVHPYFLPIEAKSNQVQWKEFATVGTPLAAILNRMVREDYRDRYQSAAEVKNLLKSFIPNDLSGYRSPARFFQESKAVPLQSVIQRQTVAQPAAVKQDTPAPVPPPSRYILNRVLIGIFALICITLGATMLVPTENKKSSPVGSEFDRTAAELIRQSEQKIKDYDYQGALNDAELALKNSPSYYPAYLARGNAKSNLNNINGAINDYKQAMAIDNNNGNAYYYRGLAHFKLNNYREAIEDYNLAIERDSSNADYHRARGEARSKTEDNQGAMDDYSKAIEFAPKVATNYNSRASLKKDLGNHKGAIEDYSKAIAVAPQDLTAYQGRAMSRSDQKDYKGAIADYNKAIEIDPKDGSNYSSRANVKYESGDKSGALADFNKSVEIDPKSAISYYQRALYWLRVDNKSRAMADLDQCLKIDPKETAGYEGRGNLKAQLGDKAGAIKDYQKAIEIGATTGETYWSKLAKEQLKELQSK